MSIDLKWVRHDAPQVLQWQQLRGLDRQDILNKVIELDQEQRRLLHQITQLQRQSQTISKQLRNSTTTNREALKDQKKEYQSQIQALQQNQQRHVQQQLQDYLRQLASPVDTQLLEQFETAHPPRRREEWEWNWNLTQAMMNYAHWYWSARYGTPQWSSSSWTDWMAQSVPRKSIWGAKQLPQFVLLRGSTTTKSSTDENMPTLQLLAMTAGTDWDSRTLQIQLLQECLAFYQSLGMSCTAHSLLPTELELHETSRLWMLCGNVVVGCVSNWGDAHSRTWELSFKGGGTKGSKDHVHMVHAQLVSPDTLQGFVEAHRCDAQHVRLPKCLAPYILPDTMHSEDDDMSGGLLPLASPKPWTKRRSDPKASKIQLLDTTKQISRHGVQVEALSCPFGCVLSPS